MANDWFRKTTGSEADQADFFVRLKRCRTAYNKAQCLRIQASHLEGIGSHEMLRASLELLDKLFAEFPEQTQLASVYSQKASCLANSNEESQRDSGLKPKVARNELPWVSASHVNNPNGVVARRRKRGATPLGLRTFTATTQGSSFLATLGWLTHSRWDCRGQMIFRTAPSSFLQLPFQKGIRTKTVSQRIE